MNDGIVHWKSCSTQEENRFADKGVTIPASDSEKQALLDQWEHTCNYRPFQQWAWNLIALIAITLWSGCICALMFYLLNVFGLLR